MINCLRDIADACSTSARRCRAPAPGAIYATCVGNAVKWFPDRRGLAVGITAGGFGAGAALTVIPIRMLIDSAGYASAFFWFGLGQGVILLLIAPIMRAPLPGEMPQTAPPKVPQIRHQLDARPRCCARRCSGCCT